MMGMKGISPVVATTLLIAIAVVTVVTTGYWVSAYTTKPAIADSSFKAYTVTGVYKNASKTGCGAIDIKNTGGVSITNALFYIKDYRTGKPAGMNGTDPSYLAVVNVSSLGPGTTSSFNITSPGTTSFAETDAGDTGGLAYESVIGDADRDGLKEIVSGGQWFARMYKYSGGTWRETNFTDQDAIGNVYSIAVGDVNNDTQPEIVMADTYAYKLRTYENKSGGWVETNVTNIPSYVYGLAVGDANNDGKSETVIGFYGPGDHNKLRMYENKTGKWVETNVSNLSSFVAVEAVAIGDVNNDGKNEIAIGLRSYNSYPNETRIYENKSGGWVETNISSWDSDIWFVAIGDADNDGQNELAVVGENIYNNYVLRIYKNVTGKWAETNVTSLNTSVLSLAIGDANNDGQNEVVIGAAQYANEVRMYKNMSGGWVETNISDEDTDVWGITIGDANNDGKNEIIASSGALIKLFSNGAGNTYVPLGAYILRTSTPGFADQLFTCA
jgi:hypothetical protein